MSTQTMSPAPSETLASASTGADGVTMPSTVGVTERTCRKSALVPRVVAAVLGCLVLAGCTSQRSMALR